MLLYYDLLNDSVSRVNNEKIIQWINWNEIELTPRLRSGDPNAASAKLNLLPEHPVCLLSALTAAVVSGGGWEELVSPDGSLEGDGLESPLWPLTSGFQEWTVVFPLTLLEACLWLFNLSNDLWTLSMSVRFWLFWHVWLWTAAEICS